MRTASSVTVNPTRLLSTRYGNGGKVQVVNACREKNGKVKTARGTAKVIDRKTNAKLKVTFFWPFYGD